MATNPQPNPDWSRRHGVRAGNEFVDALWLDGYEHHSIWGYDIGVSSFFAQIYTNGVDANEEPELWLTPPTYQMSWAEILVPPIVEFTGHDPIAVIRAMGIASPEPRIAEGADIARRLDEWTHRPASEHRRGQIDALGWILGRGNPAPASLTIPETGGPPSAADVEAEAAHATGLVYLTHREYIGGVEDALVTSVKS